MDPGKRFHLEAICIEKDGYIEGIGDDEKDIDRLKRLRYIPVGKKEISMELLGHPKIVEILESAFAPFRCEVKYWGGPIKYIIFKLFDKDGNSLGVARKEKMGVMRNPEKLKFQIFGIRNQLKKEQGIEFSMSDEMIERMIG